MTTPRPSAHSIIHSAGRPQSIGCRDRERDIGLTGDDCTSMPCAAWTGNGASGVGVDDAAWAEACRLTVAGDGG